MPHQAPLWVISLIWLGCSCAPCCAQGQFAGAQDAASAPGANAAVTAETLKANLMNVAAWSSDELTSEHVEAVFGVKLGPSVALGHEGLTERHSEGPLHVSLSTEGPVYRNLVIDWGAAPGNPTELEAPTVCVTVDEISDELLRRGWSLDHVTTGAPLDNIYSADRTASREYRRTGEESQVTYGFTTVYVVHAGMQVPHCASQFILSESPVSRGPPMR
jgi:hypothetical protein